MIRLVFKRNDQETAPGEEMLGMRHGMLVDYHREGEYWPTLSTKMKQAFLVLEIEDTVQHRNTAIGACDPTNVTLPDGSQDKANSRARSQRLNVASLAAHIGMPNLDEMMRGSDAIEPIVYNPPNLSAILVSTATLAAVSKDVRAVSSGSYTVGSGGDYATWAAAVADLANLTGDLTFTQISATTEVAAATMTELLGGYTITYTSNNKPNGDPTAGWVTSMNANALCLHFNAASSSGVIDIDGLYFKSIATNTNIFAYVQSTGVTTFMVRNCMFDHNGKASRSAQSNDGSTILAWFNNVTWGSSSANPMMNAFLCATTSVIENNTVYDCPNAEGIDCANNALTIRNNACYGNAVDFAQIGTATGYNNSDTDGTAANANWATGAGNRTGTAVADFVSVTDTDATFLDIAPAGGLCEVGYTTLLAVNTSCIHERDRPNSRTTVSIGAAEAVYPVITTPLMPNTGPVAGGTTVTISGSGFQASGATITFGGDAASNDAQTDVELTVTTPAHAAGAVDVVVTNAWGGSTTSSGAFTYEDAVPVVTGDDIEDLLGVSTLWDIGLDWKTNPSRQVYQGRTLLELSTSRITVQETNDFLAQEVRALITGMSAAEVTELITFFNARLGRLRRFWFPVIARKFTIVEDLSQFATTITVESCGFAATSQGYERIIIYMDNGDRITRGIESALDNGDGTETLTLITPLYRDITATSVLLCCPLILGRFMADELSLNHKTAHVAEVSIAIKELVRDYTQAGGS